MRHYSGCNFKNQIKGIMELVKYYLAVWLKQHRIRITIAMSSKYCFMVFYKVRKINVRVKMFM